MFDTTAQSSPKETDSVLLRLPASLKSQAMEIAGEKHISANALFSAGVLHATVLYGILPRLYSPANLKALLDDIDEACAHDREVMGAFNPDDWNDLRGFIDLLEQVSWIRNVQVRNHAAMRTTIYRFGLTKVGRAMWPGLSEGLRDRISRLGDSDPGPLMKIMNAEG